MTYFIRYIIYDFMNKIKKWLYVYKSTKFLKIYNRESKKKRKNTCKNKLPNLYIIEKIF